MKNITVAVCGATATGKTSLALMLAERNGGEIISSDSMQLYRGMDIGTAKPAEDELLRVPHHMIDVLDPDESCSVADYAALAAKAEADILERGRLPVYCGGTGLYLDAVMYKNKFSAAADPKAEREAAAKAEAYLSENGADALHALLRAADPEAADAIHPNNVRRVIRALVIYETTGKTKTEWDAASRGEIRGDVAVVGLRFRDRELHRRAIGERCGKMIENGLVEETERLYKLGALDEGKTAAQAIGYKEILPFIRGEESLSDAEKRLFYATCRYAKRQATWFYARDYVNWIEVDGLYLGYESKEEIYSRALAVINEKRGG